MIGDSVMVGAGHELARMVPSVDIDAAVGRQVSAAIAILRADRDAGRLGSVVVIHMGTNGTFTRSQFDEIMGLLASTRHVLFVNDKVPRPWQTANDRMLADAVKSTPKAMLVDWYAASINHPELFWDDETHLRPQGAHVYAALIEAQITSAGVADQQVPAAPG
jgi:hypothetical protein